MSKLEEEAKKYMETKKKKLPAAQQTKLRVYMSSALCGLLASGRVHRSEEAIEEAYRYALRCLEFEKTNF